MKKLLFILFFVLPILVKSQETYEWVKLIKSQLGNVECTDVVSDENGNTYVCGIFEATATFDTISKNSLGGFDLFLAKLDKDGDFIWVKTGGGSFDDRWGDIEYLDGHIYATGYFSFQANFLDTNLISNGGTDIFISKIDTSGNLKWVKTGGSDINAFPFASDFSNSISINDFNEIYIGAFVYRNAIFEGDTLVPYTSTFIFRRAVVIRYDTAGNYIDGFLPPGGSSRQLVKVDTLNRIILPFSQFTSLPVLSYYLTTAWNRNFIFQNTSISVGFANNYELGISPNNDQILGLEFQGSSFGINNTTYASSGGTDFLIVSLNENGQLNWVKQMGGGGNDKLQDIKSDSTGIYISGFFNTSATIDTTIVTGFGQSFYVAKLDFQGNLIWVNSGGNGVGVNGNAITVLGEKESVIVGDFLSQMTIGGQLYNGVGFRDGYVAKLGCRPSKPLKVFGDTSVCFDTSKYYVEFEQGVSHTWKLDSGGTLLNTTGDTILIVWKKAGQFNLSVTPSNSCGVGPDQNLEINVKANPEIPIISGDSSICLGSHQFLISNPEPALYNWQNAGSAIKIDLGINALYTWSTAQFDSITVTATNSCGSTTSDQFIVDVASTPTQAPTIQGNTSGCAGTSVFTLQNNIVGETYVWNSPGAQVNIINDSAQINFPSSGNYSISAYAQNQCGNGPSGLLTVVVDDVPNQPFGFSGDLTPCVGVENYAINPQLNTSYLWSIDSGGAIIPLGNSASVLWNKKGNFNITITPSNQCGVGQSLVNQVEVNDIPTIPNSILGEDTVCLGSQQYLTNLSDGTPLWSLTGGGALNSNANVATINWVSPGNYILSVSGTNACGTSNPKSKVISVDTISNALAVINGSNTACKDTSTTYDVIFQNGQTYNWQLDSGGILIDSANTSKVVWQKEGFFNLKVSTSNGCNTSKVVEVIGLPENITSFTGDTLICSGTNAYSFNPQPGINYNWQTKQGGNIFALGASAFVSWNTAQLDTLEVIGSNQCASINVLSIPIEIEQTPFLNSIIGDSLLCQNATINYSTQLDPTWNYLWQTSSGVLNAALNMGNINWIDTGVFNIQVNASNFCGTSNTVTKSIEVLGQPKAPNQLIGDLNPCVGMEEYTINVIANQTYQWILGSGGQLSANNDSASINWTTEGNQNLVIIPQSICGSGLPVNFNILVNDVPAKPNYTGQTNICKTNSFFTATANNADSIHWKSTNNFGLDTTSFSFNLSSIDTGFYSLILTPKNICGLGDSLVQNVKVIDVQTPKSIIGDSTSCLNTSAYSTPLDTATSYLWNLSGGGSLNAFNNSAQVQWLGQGIFDVEVRIQNKCGIGSKFTKSISISDVPALPTLTSGDTLPCVGNELFETFNDPNSSYYWQFDTLLLSDTGNAITYAIASNDTIDLVLYGKNQCGFSDTSIFKIKPTEKPQLQSTILGDSTLCFGNTQSFVAFHNGDLLNWSINGGGFLSPANDSVLLTPTTKGNYLLSVATWNKCGIGESDTISIEIQDVPSQPSAFVGALKTCKNAIDSFFTVSPDAKQLNWSLASGGSILGDINGAEISWNSSGTFLLEATPTNFCGIGPKRSALVEVLEIPDAPQLIGGDTMVCKGNEAYTASSNIKANYQWKTNGPFAINTIGNSAQINWDTTGNYTLQIVSDNFCGLGDSVEYNIIVQGLPEDPTSIIGNDSVCIGEDFQAAFSTQSVNYLWTLPSGGSITPKGDSVRILWSSPGDHQLTLRHVNSCGQSNDFVKTIHIDGFPQPPLFSVANPKACVNDSNVFYAIPSFGSTINWFVEDGEFIAYNDSIKAYWQTTGEKIISAFEENNCGQSAPVSYTIQLNEAPFISGSILGQDTICINTESVYEIPNKLLTSYTWLFSNKADFSTIDNIAEVAWDTAFTDSILVSASNYCGTSNNVPFEVTIVDLPTAPDVFIENDTLKASTNENNILWYFEGTPISGEDGKKLTPTQQGYYQASVFNVCGEEVFSEKVLFGFDTETAGIRVYPNPSQNQTFIELPINLNWTDLEILNNLGQPIYITQFEGENLLPFNTSFLPMGIYLVRVNTEFGLKTMKLVKN